MNVYSGGEYGYNRGFYSYKDKAKDIKNSIDSIIIFLSQPVYFTTTAVP